MTDAMPLPPAMARRAREFSGPPAPARPAATVVLLRPTAGSPGSAPAFEAYVLRRASTMTFGGVYAFPGGGVDPTDQPETVRTDWADRLGVPAEQARAVVGAAARELFEEAGVLLAGPADPAPGRDDVDTPGGNPAELAVTVGNVGTADWEADRAALAGRELTMTELLRRRGLRLRDDLLLPWSRWITPEFEPKRFDTWFFVALLPEAQTARDVSGEADQTAWINPAGADELTMLPPTRYTLRQLAACRTLPEVVAASVHRDAAAPVIPQVVIREDGAVLRVPLD